MKDDYKIEDVKRAIAAVYYSNAGGYVYNSSDITEEYDLVKLAVKTARHFKSEFSSYMPKTKNGRYKKTELPVFIYNITAFDRDKEFDIYYGGGISQGGKEGNGVYKEDALWAPHIKLTYVVV